MPVRWPFVTAIVVLFLGIGGWLLAPSAHRAWQTRAYNNQMRPLRPGIDVMARLSVPAGTTVCKTGQQVVATGVMCWQSVHKPVAATTDLVGALKAAGAANVVAKCVSEGDLKARCTVTARLAGVAYQAYVTPKVQYGAAIPFRIVGAEIVGGMSALGMVPSVLPTGTPIPVPIPVSS